MTFADVGPAMRPFYRITAWCYPLSAVWLALSAALAGGAVVRFFRGVHRGAERAAAPVPALLGLANVFGWALLTAVLAAA